MALFIGIDGCRRRWLCVVREDVGPLSARIVDTADVVALARSADMVAIDVPLGIADRGGRACETEARRRLGRPRASSVFSVPARAALAARDYVEARRLSLAATGKSLAIQSFGILPGIGAFDAALRAEPTLVRTLRETHPELVFMEWNGGRPLTHSKRTPEGRAERQALIRPDYGDVRQNLGATLPSGAWAIDDLLDAVAALRAAERIAAGRAVTIPETPEFDSCGLPMRMAF